MALLTAKLLKSLGNVSLEALCLREGRAVDQPHASRTVVLVASTAQSREVLFISRTYVSTERSYRRFISNLKL